MSQAEELLNSMSEEETVAVAAVVDNEPHIVVGTDKFIAVPPELRKIAIQHEHNVKTVTFDCPRYWDGRDLMDMVICVNYKTPNNVIAPKEVENVTVDPNDITLIHFDWTITKSVTQMNGTLSFLLCGVKTNASGMEEQHWNSELNREMTISEGLECSQTILEEYPDVIADILTRLRKLEDGGGSNSGTSGGSSSDTGGSTTTTPSLLIVTLDIPNGTVDHNATEIISHVEAGGIVLLKNPVDIDNPDSVEAGYIPLSGITSGFVMFKGVEVYEDCIVQYLYTIMPNGSYSTIETLLKPASGEGGSTTSSPTTTEVDFSNWANGSFTETLSDGTTRVYEVTLDETGAPISVGGITIAGVSSLG